jgi:hypothetical protein
MEHLPTCAEGNAKPADHEHKWSGWPGAYCLICGCEDPIEVCLADCKCPCHDTFWKEYRKVMERE